MNNAAGGLRSKGQAGRREKRVKKPGLIFVVSGPSGSGKTTLIKGALEDKNLSKRFVRSVSFTTRLRRSGEKNGKDYYFISKKEFLDKRKGKKLLEWTRYLGYYYGTSREFVETQIEKGKNLFFCIDIAGARNVKKIFPGNNVTIFIAPGDLDELAGRIKGRCRETKAAEIKKRIEIAAREMRSSSSYDYCVVNRDLKQALREFKGIVLNEIKFKNRIASSLRGK